MKCFLFYSIILSSILLCQKLEPLSGIIVEEHNIQKYGKSIMILTITINPSKYKFEIINSPNKELSLKDISNNNNCLMVFNAGMFDVDYKTNMGYMKNNGQILNSRYHPNYYSVLAFEPILEDIPEVYIYDSDEISMDTIVAQYNSIIENLRLIKRPGINRWPEQDKRWSEIAIGQDLDGNMILIYCETSLSMFELNEILLSLPIKLQAAQHLDGNAVGQFYLKIDEYELNYDNYLYAPNLIGVKMKPQVSK